MHVYLQYICKLHFGPFYGKYATLPCVVATCNRLKRLIWWEGAAGATNLQRGRFVMFREVKTWSSNPEKKAFGEHDCIASRFEQRRSLPVQINRAVRCIASSGVFVTTYLNLDEWLARVVNGSRKPVGKDKVLFFHSILQLRPCQFVNHEMGQLDTPSSMDWISFAQGG